MRTRRPRRRSATTGTGALAATDIKSVTYTDKSAASGAGATVAGNVANKVWTAAAAADAAPAVGTADTVVVEFQGNWKGTITFYLTSTTANGGKLAIADA